MIIIILKLKIKSKIKIIMTLMKKINIKNTTLPPRYFFQGKFN